MRGIFAWAWHSIADPPAASAITAAMSIGGASSQIAPCFKPGSSHEHEHTPGIEILRWRLRALHSQLPRTLMSRALRFRHTNRTQAHPGRHTINLAARENGAKHHSQLFHD
jgi:hypothetical protein